MQGNFHTVTQVWKAVEISVWLIFADVDRTTLWLKDARITRLEPNKDLSLHRDGHLGDEFFHPATGRNHQLLGSVLSGWRDDFHLSVACLPARDCFVELKLCSR